MPDKVDYLDITRHALSEISGDASEILKILEEGDKQADTRQGVIQTVHEMCDALQLACDLISKEISSSILEFNGLRKGNGELLNGYFTRTAFKFSSEALRQLLHEGKVCGELHALGDRFKQPLTDVTTGGVSLWENVKAFFSRSTSMSIALEGLYEGERNYLYNLSDFLFEIRDRAEAATSLDLDDVEGLRSAGEQLVGLMREKRQVLQDQIREVKLAADDCVKKLH